MKKTLRNMMIVIVLLVFAFTLVSCGTGIKAADAKDLINEFFNAVVEEDYQKAKTLLHPECSADIENFFLQVEKEKSVDFQRGITIDKYTGFSTSLYDSSVGGSRYELTMKTTVDGKSAEFTIEIIKNEAGYGIYHIGLKI